MTETIMISVRVQKDISKRLIKLAKATDRSKSYIVSQAIEEFLTLHEWQAKSIRQGMTEADAGKLLPHKEAVKRRKIRSQRGA